MQPEATTLTFQARSSMHPVNGTAAQFSGHVDAATEGGVLVLDPQPAMHVEFPVERLRSGLALQDNQMFKMLDSKRSPMVAADLRELGPDGEGQYKAAGDITLSGRTRRYEGTVTIAVDGERLTVDGMLVIDIRNFGLQPPKLFMITVEPEVAVRLHLVAALAAGAA